MKTLANKKMVRNSGNGAAKIAVIKNTSPSGVIPYLVKKGCAVRIFSFKTPIADIEEWNPKGFILAGDGGGNHPYESFEANRSLLTYIKNSGLPVFGMGFAHQLLAISEGLNIIMKEDNSRESLPVMNRLTGKVEIKKSHGDACFEIHSINKSRIDVTHVGINNQHVEGVQYKRFPGFSVQYEPATSDYLLNHFVDLINMQVFKKRPDSYSARQPARKPTGEDILFPSSRSKGVV